MRYLTQGMMNYPDRLIIPGEGIVDELKFLFKNELTNGCALDFTWEKDGFDLLREVVENVRLKYDAPDQILATTRQLFDDCGGDEEIASCFHTANTRLYEYLVGNKLYNSNNGEFYYQLDKVKFNSLFLKKISATDYELLRESRSESVD